MSENTKLLLDREKVKKVLESYIFYEPIGENFKMTVTQKNTSETPRQALSRQLDDIADQICQLILKEGIVITRGNIEYGAGIKIGGKYVDDKLIPIAGKKAN